MLYIGSKQTDKANSQLVITVLQIKCLIRTLIESQHVYCCVGVEVIYLNLDSRLWQSVFTFISVTERSAHGWELIYKFADRH